MADYPNAPKRLLPPEAAVGLDLFAAAWLERWKAYGGSVLFDADGGMRLGMIEPPNHATYDDVEAGPGIKERINQSRRYFADGAVRELLDLLDLVPGGKEALKRHSIHWKEYSGWMA